MSFYSHFYQENTLSDSQSIELPSTSHQDSGATQSGSNSEALVDNDSFHENPIATLSESMTEAPDIDNISSEEPSALDSGANANIEPSATDDGCNSLNSPATSNSQNERRGICIFCSKKERRVGTRRVYPILCPSKDAFQSIKALAEFVKDKAIEGIDENSVDIYYHKVCYTFYQSGVKEKKTTKCWMAQC